MFAGILLLFCVFYFGSMADPDFRSGDFDIHYLSRKGDELLGAAGSELESTAALAAALVEHEARSRVSAARIATTSPAASGWKRPQSWRSW